MKPLTYMIASILGLAVLLTGCSSSNSSKKNIIVMISDGASDGAWDLASFWQEGQLLNNSYPYTELTTRYAMATYALNGNLAPDLSEQCDPALYAEGFSYDPEKAHDKTIVSSEPTGEDWFPFAGYEYLDTNYTDSAASGTAIATGQSTYNGAISMNNCGEELPIITQFAKKQGLSTGVVSSVPFSHATPAVFGATNIKRSNTTEIATDMLNNGYLDLIMGAGHPEYDVSGEKLTENDYGYIGMDTWNKLKAGELTSTEFDSTWTFFDSKADFEVLASGKASNDMLDGPLIGIPQNSRTLQYSRSCGAGQDKPFSCALNDNVPDLATMSKGALNYLSQNEKGFFVMIEGGAVDWAAHSRDTAGIIEEQVDFNKAVKAVYDWVEANSNWDETLLIVTTDHGNAFVLGEFSSENFYEPVENSGQGVMPQVSYYSGSHTNELVRFYAKGNGSDKFEQHVIGKDEEYVTRYRHTGTDGSYFQNKHIFNAVKELIEE